MSSTQVSTEQQRANRVPTAATVDLKLEVIAIPVSDVDRAKAFYGGLGWTLDADFMIGKDFRAVQLTPPGSPCSIHLSTTAVPGSAQGMFLVVSDIGQHAKSSSRAGRRVEVFHFDGPSRGAWSGRKTSVLWLIRLIQRSRRQSLGSSTGQDAPSRTRTQPGRRHFDRAFARNRETPWHVRADRSETPLVWLVLGLHRRARAREECGRGSQGCNAPH